MTRYLENAWYFGGWADQLKAGEIKGVTIAGRAIALFRDEAGSLGAIGDRCPHRFAPLHMGKVRGSNVECGYHGVQFGADGRCAFNPHSKGATPSSVSVPSYPVVERDRAIWLWFSQSAEADPSLIPDMGWLSTIAATAIASVPTMHVKADYQLLIDNLFDPVHADFLHAGTLGGNGLMTNARPTIRTGTYLVEADWKFDGQLAMPFLRHYLPGPEQIDTWLTATWYAPTVVLVLGGIKPAGAPRDEGLWVASYHILTPAEEGKTTYDVMNVRNFAVDDAEMTQQKLKISMNAFNNEDKPMIEAQYAAMKGQSLWDLKPALLPIDTATVQVRRTLEALIDESLPAAA